jgi:myosin heavy subunit
VPISRLNEVIQQRDNLKSQLQELNKQLEEIRNSSKNNEDLQKQMQELINKNQELMKQMEQAKIESEIIFAAKDAINPKDVLVFINFDKIKIDKDGKVVGIEEELNRLRQEKSYLFQQQAPKKGGVDPNEDKQQKQQINMNALIRRAAGRKF